MSLRNAFAALATDTKLEQVRTLLAGTLPVAVQSLPLPPGAASDAKLDQVRALLASTLAVAVQSLPLPTGAATDTKLDQVRALLAGTLAIGAQSLPLPIGAATDAKLELVRLLLAGTLNVASVLPAATSAPLTGTANATGVLGPFAPQRGRAIAIKLSGIWSGSVTVRSSIDSGTTKLPLTVGGRAWGVFTANANEAELTVPTIAGETFYLDVTIASGSLGYWMGQ